MVCCCCCYFYPLKISKWKLSFQSRHQTEYSYPSLAYTYHRMKACIKAITLWQLLHGKPCSILIHWNLFICPCLQVLPLMPPSSTHTSLSELNGTFSSGWWALGWVWVRNQILVIHRLGTHCSAVIMQAKPINTLRKYSLEESPVRWKRNWLDPCAQWVVINSSMEGSPQWLSV